MRNITYKYKVGDKVQFKNSFHPSASCGLRALAGRIVTIVECKDYNGPCYRVDCLDSFFTEKCFAGFAGLIDSEEEEDNCE